MDLRQQKQRVRQQVAAAIAAIPPAERKAMDAAAVERGLETLHCFLAQSRLLIAGYMPLADEVEITPLLLEFFEHGARLCLPRLERDGDLTLREVKDFSQLVVGCYGILEPPAEAPEVAAPSVDLALVPGRAFTPTCLRLGRGRGCYDRLLRRMLGRRVAFAYDCQMLESIPVSAEDEAVHMVITPTRVWQNKCAS
ncbi:MAG: 5-formyltetrahydrofolate cyclo-ligase [Planctomycetota bacterium]|nr:5-formyltetrahydrofolate cyclo-ligase [Planctomycetota bacterium]